MKRQKGGRGGERISWSNDNRSPISTAARSGCGDDGRGCGVDDMVVQVSLVVDCTIYGLPWYPSGSCKP